ncbi:MAG: ATP-binding protein [Ignavibacteria bacterium]|nr:ATP-binding protein [Ignavibacteria bacterium]
MFILDTNKKVVSDFNINPNELNSDSVVNSSIRNLAGTNSVTDDDEIYESEPDSLELNLSSLQFEDGKVIQNSEMKFYASISSIENPSLRHSGFRNILGYIIIAAGYEAKNYLTQSNFGIFGNFTKGNIINKLTSTPVITEFTDGEIAGSSNREVSRSFTKSLDAFRESVKDKVDKSALRYDEFENQIYKSYYVLTQSRISGNTPVEKIYIVSVKVNDFSLITFFFFRYLLFVVTIFCIILLIYLIYKLILFITSGNKFIKFGFREKVFASFLLASLIPIIILAAYTREFVKNKNEEFYKNSIISDLKLVENYLKKKKDELITSHKGEPSYREIFSKGFIQSEKNFNYYVKNKLVSTTSEQLYKSDLLDSRISGKAFYNISILKRDFFSESQNIGDFTFIVGYKPVYDKFNNLVGILSSQTVFRQYEINSELTESLVYILGPYFSAVIILIFIVNFLSYRISNPILKLQKATEQLSKGNTDIRVKSKAKDEIGELVRSFNRMVKELKRSREELKKAEREGAWRDIARQVAHEIKNPLTPMKLSIQYLYSSYKNNSGNFSEILERTKRLIIDQIESLNRIATEFSDFAKMPSRNYEELSINEILNDLVSLLNTDNLIKLKTGDEVSDVKIRGDKYELKRALLNIIKNSIQAVEAKDITQGKIEITAEKTNGYLNVKICDNGIGMSKQIREKLFEPYFSTKSSGMGLGLVITKKILDDMKADIKVKSTPEVGTEVDIRFPLS